MGDPVDIFPPIIDDDPVRRTLDCLREGFQIVGFDWTYIYLNPAAARHGRRSAHELAGRPMREAYPGIEDTPLFATLRRAMEQRTSHVFENEFTFPDGGTRWFEIRVQPVPEGICIYSSDIDDRKRKETATAAAGRAARPPLARRIARLFGGQPL